MSDRITISCCAKQLKKAPSTIRRLVAKGIVSTVQDERNRHTVVLDEVLSYYARQSGANEPKQESQSHDHDIDLIHSLRTQIALLERSLDREAARCDSLDKTVQELQKEIFNLTREIKALLEDSNSNIWQLPFRWKRKAS